MVPAKRRGRPSRGVRDAALTAAQEILAEAGVARLSTRHVAQRAGVAESSIFYHFGDRLGLLVAVVHQYLPPVEEVLGEVAPEGELRGRLVAIMRTLEDFFVKAIPLLSAIESDAQLRGSYVERSHSDDIGPHRAVRGVRAVLADRYGAEGPGSAADLDSVALLLVGAAHQRALQRTLRPDIADRLASPESLVDTLIGPPAE